MLFSFRLLRWRSSVSVPASTLAPSASTTEVDCEEVSIGNEAKEVSSLIKESMYVCKVGVRTNDVA